MDMMGETLVGAKKSNNDNSVQFLKFRYNFYHVS